MNIINDNFSKIKLKCDDLIELSRAKPSCMDFVYALFNRTENPLKDKMLPLFKSLSKPDLAYVVGRLFETFRKEKNEKFYRYLQEMFPDSTQMKANAPFSPEQLSKLVAYLKAKGSLKADCFVAEELSDLLGGIEQIALKPKFSCFVLGRTYIPNTPFQYCHVYPLYIEKNETGLHLVITDSKGQHITNDALELFLAKLVKALPTAHIYSLAMPRQCKEDQYNCGIFALRDVVELSRIPNVLETIQKLKLRAPTEEEDCMVEKKIFKGKFYVFDDLPPALMKSSQFMSKIQSPKYCDAIVKSKKHPEGEPLKALVVRHTKEINKKSVNVYIEQRAAKYKKLLYEQAIRDFIFM